MNIINLNDIIKIANETLKFIEYQYRAINFINQNGKYVLAMTYDGWKNNYKNIIKGEKSVIIFNNEHYFLEYQVKPKEIRGEKYYGECDFDGVLYSEYSDKDWEGVASRSPGLYMDLHRYHKNIHHNSRGAYQRVYNHDVHGLVSLL